VGVNISAETERQYRFFTWADTPVTDFLEKVDPSEPVYDPGQVGRAPEPTPSPAVRVGRAPPTPENPWSKESLKAKGFGASSVRLKDKKDKTPQEQVSYDVIIGKITKTEGGRRATEIERKLREEERSKRMSERQQLLTPGSDRLGSETHGRPDNQTKRDKFYMKWKCKVIHIV